MSLWNIISVARAVTLPMSYLLQPSFLQDSPLPRPFLPSLSLTLSNPFCKSYQSSLESTSKVPSHSSPIESVTQTAEPPPPSRSVPFIGLSPCPSVVQDMKLSLAYVPPLCLSKRPAPWTYLRALPCQPGGCPVRMESQLVPRSTLCCKLSGLCPYSSLKLCPPRFPWPVSQFLTISSNASTTTSLLL